MRSLNSSLKLFTVLFIETRFISFKLPRNLVLLVFSVNNRIESQFPEIEKFVYNAFIKDVTRHKG
jgi:hypothetical protein